MDEKTKAAYRQYFDQRHGVRSLPDLQPGDSVRVKLDQQKGWKSPRKVIAKSPTPRSYIVYVVQTPFTVVHGNRRHLGTATSPGGFVLPDEQDLDVEPETQAEGHAWNLHRMNPNNCRRL